MNKKYEEEENQEQMEDQETKQKTVIIISSCPRSISLLIGLQPWGLWNLCLCPIEGFREAALRPCACCRRECRPCIWPCRSLKGNVLVNVLLPTQKETSL